MIAAGEALECSAHVLSVGTSALRNFQRTCTDKNLASALLKLERGELELSDMKKVLSASGLTLDDLIDKVAQFIKNDPVQASAELNALVKRAGSLQGLKAILLCSDTHAGQLSCKALKTYLEGEGAEAAAYVINNLGKRGTFYEGLVNLMCAYGKILDKEVGDCKSCVCVNPTGGFKPESAVTYLLALADARTADVYYIHEAFRDVVSLPIFPVVPLKALLSQTKWLDESLKALKDCLKGKSLYPWRPLEI